MVAHIVIDRFEGDYAVCEADNGEIINILRKEIPKDAKAGDWLKADNGVYLVDKAITEEKRNENKAMLTKLINKSKKDSQA